MNLLDYAAIAVPTSFTQSKMPFGITLFSDAMTDQKLLSLAARIQTNADLPLGATDWPLNSTSLVNDNKAFIDLVVCGAHLSSMALNSQLTERNAVLLEETQTAEKYQMFAIAGQVERPAMIRNDDKGQSFIVEVWRLPIAEFGSFVAGITQPLGIGKVELADGRWLTGFIAEGYAEKIGQALNQYSGWREYKAKA